MDIERLLNIIISITVFGLVLSIWCFCVFMWLGQYLVRIQKIQERLGLTMKETPESKILRLWRDTQHADYRLEAATKLTFHERLRVIGNDAGWQTPIQVIILGVIGVAVLLSVIAFVISQTVIAGFGAFIAVIVAFWAYTQHRIGKRSALFERQLVDALGIASRSLRAGHPLVGAFQLISEEVGEPLNNVFFMICQEQSLGLDLRDSMRKAARATANRELRLFATAVAIQVQTGGNLADLMDSLGTVIRARMRLNRKVRVLTTQSRFSTRILVALPILLFFILHAISPDYMSMFYRETVGMFMLGAMIVSVTLGWWCMNRLTVLRY